MKIILQNAITLNGFIADTNGNTSFVTDEEYEASYLPKVKEVGTIIMGKATYDVSQDDLPLYEEMGAKIVVVTSKKHPEDARVGCWASDPQEAVKYLEVQGIDEVLLIGGGGVNKSFLEAGLVDEILIDVEPCILGDGIPIFRSNKIQVQLKLLGMKEINPGLVQLHYQVVK